MLGLAITLQSRRHSRLTLARHLPWLALFGFVHSLYEWGDIFIPLQATYLPVPFINLLKAIQLGLLSLSFACLFQCDSARLYQGGGFGNEGTEHSGDTGSGKSQDKQNHQGIAQPGHLSNPNAVATATARMGENQATCSFHSIAKVCQAARLGTDSR